MRGARIAGFALIAAVAGFVAAQWLWPREEPALPTSPAPAAVPAPAAPETPAVSPAAELRIDPSGTLEIDAASIQPGKPVVVHLDLGQTLRTDEPRPVRIVSVDGRVFDAQARLDAERKQARVEFDSAFLRPGSYMVEIKTDVSHFPVRRYVIVVR
jgi:hypothetical protein